MNLQNSVVYQIDTRQNTSLTVFDGCREDESKLAKQFWNSVVLIPPVESTLVCKEIKQRIRSRTLNDGKSKPRFSTTITKEKKEKSMRDKIYDEAAAIQQAQEEAKRIQVGGKRQQQVRQLFHKQAKINRIKNEQLSIPQFNNCPINLHHQESTINFQEEFDQKEDDDRHLVSSLPD